MSFFTNGVNNIINTPKPIGMKVKIKKKVVMEYCAVISSIIPPKEPAVLLPIAMAKYHIPNMIPIILPGANLLK